MSRLLIAAAAITLGLTACAASADQQTQPQKEAAACAQMGIAPTSPTFNRCVRDLDLALLSQDQLLPH